MTEYLLNKNHGHLILETGSASLLVDTGAPSSVGKQRIHLCERDFPVMDNYLGVTLEWLIEQTGCKIDGLLGMDILSKFSVELEVPRNLIRFDETFDSEGEVIPITSVMGIPVIGIRIEGNDQQVFFDTGAQLSYADPDLMNGKDAFGEIKGFYPGFGNFKTPVYELNVELAGKSSNCSFSILPDLLRNTLMLAGNSGILGNEILQDFQCFLKMEENQMRFVSIS